MVYFDNAAGTQPYQEVIDVMVNIMQNNWYNPSAPYGAAYQANDIIEQVRAQIADDISCAPDEIIFTSGACEANSFAIQGMQKTNPTLNLITTQLEHASLLNVATNEFLPYKLKLLKNDECGFVDLKELDDLLDDPDDIYSNKKLVSICAANSEIGVKQDIKCIAKIVHANNSILHIDATQLFPEQVIDVPDLDIDLMSVSAQKFGGPRGVGFLYAKRGVKLTPIIYGSQESSLRGGTYNTAAIAGMGKALELTRKYNTMGARDYTEALRDELLGKLLTIPGTHLNGPLPGPNRLVNNISLTVDGVDAEVLTTMCDTYGFMIAKGSACQSYEQVPSKTLTAIGLTPEQAYSTIRITLGADNTMKEVTGFCEIFTKIVERIRQV